MKIETRKHLFNSKLKNELFIVNNNKINFNIIILIILYIVI